MPNKITYTITTADGKSHQVNEENIKKYGMKSYADAYEGATIRMRNDDGEDYDIPLGNFDDAQSKGLHPFRFEHTPPNSQQKGVQSMPGTNTAVQPNEGTSSQPAPVEDAGQQVWKPTAQQKTAMTTNLEGISRSVQQTMEGFNTRMDNLNAYGRSLAGGHTATGDLRFNPQTRKMERTYLTPTGDRTFNKTAADTVSREYREDFSKEAEARKRKLEEKAKMRHDPTLWETVKKSLGAGLLRAGTGLLDAVQSLTSGMYVEDASSPTGYTRTRSYEEALADKKDPMTIASSSMHSKADKMSEEAQPYSGRKGFLDMLWDGEIGGFLQKGIATAGESLPMTLSALNPYTMTLNAISMAGSNYRENTLENPDIPAWKRASQAVGSAAIEQAVEKYADPIFKYVGGNKILKGAAKNASEKISTEITKDATETLAKRIYGRLKGIGKDALGEGAEEVMSNLGNDILGETLDIIDSNKDYGLRAQWEELKKENPNADLWDFAQAKAKEDVESFIGGAMAGAYTSGTTQLSTKALQYSFNRLGNAEEENDRKTLNPLNVDVAQSFDDGYSEDEATELQDTKNLYKLQQSRMSTLLGVDTGQVDEAIGDPVNFISELQQLERTDEIQPVLDYVNSKAKYDGMIQRVRDDIDSRIDQSNKIIISRTNHTTGMIQGVTMKTQDDNGNDRKAYVLKGNLVMLNDGSIDHNKSDGSIILRDAATGAIEMVSPNAIFSMEEPVDPELEKQTAADAIRQQFAQEAANRIDSTVSFNNGDTYTLTGEDGQIFQLQIVQNQDGLVDNGDGTVNVSSDGGQTVVPMSKEEIQAMVDATNRARVEQVEQERKDEEYQPIYRLYDKVELRNSDGSTTKGFVVDDNYNEGTILIQVETPQGERVIPYTKEELERLTVNNAFNYEQSGQTNGNNGEQNILENGNIEQKNIPAPTTETEQPARTEEPVQQPSALERIPKNDKDEPIYEQADPDIAWDAIVEQAGGDEEIAKEVTVDILAEKESTLKAAEKELKKLEEGKPQQNKGDTPATMEERIAAKKAAKEQLGKAQTNVDAAKAVLAHWQKIAQTAERRRQYVIDEQAKMAAEAARQRRKQEERERAEREDAERIRREALNGVPDIIDDKPQDARARGYRRINGEKVDRQQPLQAKQGKEVQVKFDDKNIPAGHVVLIEAGELQPSHINGQRNPYHFIDEAQPKERNDEASVMSARNIASNIRPEEITSSVTAYTGAPTVNTRGEVIQGNNRSAALREMWAGQPEQAEIYKQYLAEHSAEFGMTPEDVESMQQPVLVNMIDVSDNEAINLGQFVAQDTESGGTERIKAKNIVQKMSGDMRAFANRLLSSPDEEMTFAELIDRNGMDVLKWMQQKGYITPTQYRSAFDSKGGLTAETKNDLKGVMYQSIFQNGNTHLEEMFNALPTKTQKAILATAYRDYDSPNAERMNAEIQNSISAYYALSQDPAFANAKNYKEARIAAEAWKRQLAFDDVTGESYLPAERYSNFALLLATMYKGQTQTFIQNTLKNIFDLVQGTQKVTLFEEPDNTPRTLVKAINETVSNLSDELLLNGNFIYNGQQRNNVLASNSAAGQQGKQGSHGSTPARKQTEDGERTSDSTGGTESSSRQSEIILEEETENALSKRVQIDDDDWTEGSEKTPTYKRSVLIDGKYHVTQVDEPNDKGNYDGSYFVYDGKRFAGIPEVIEYIDKHPTLGEKIESQEQQVNTNPSEAQKEVGNYKKGHIQVGSFNVTIEQPKGSVRRGTDEKGNSWETTMQNTYDYIRGTKGVDGDHIDVFLSNNINGWNGRRVFVVDQYNEDGSFDEHKVMMGFNSQEEAQEAYFFNYEKDWEKKRKIVVSSVNLEDFEKWIQSSHRKTKPFAEYKSVKTVNDNLSRTVGDLKRQLSDFKVGDVVHDYYNNKLYRIKKHSTNGVSTLAELDENGDEISTTTINAYNNARYSLAKTPTKQETTALTNNSFSIKPAQYTTKRGKVLDMHLVKFGRELTKEEQRNAKALAKELKGWYDSKQGGFMMRSKEDAQQLVDAIMDESGETLADAAPLSLNDMQKVSSQTSSDNVNASENTDAPIKQENVSAQSGNQLVSDQRYEELKKRMKAKLGQLNIGIDPEIIAIGAEMAVYHIERGARKFADYSKSMIDDLGDVIRPYLKSFYNAVRDMPEAIETGLVDEMTPYEEVRTFDVANFDKPQPDPFATAETVVAEQQISRQVEESKQKIVNQRNKNRRNENEQTSANTETIVGQAEVIASDAESRIEKAETEEEVAEAIKDADKHLQAIDDQLSALDYIDNLHSGMRVILKDGRNVMLSVVMHVGEQVSASQMSAPRIGRLYGSYHGNLIAFTPDDIDVDATIKLNELRAEQPVIDNKQKKEVSYNGYNIGDKVIYTPKNRTGKPEEATIYDFEAYGSHNPVLDTGLAPILYEVVEWDEIRHTDTKESMPKQEKKKEKFVPSQKIADLFDSSNADAKRRFSETVRTDMLSALDTGEKPYRSILDLRKRASDLGMDIDKDGRTDILLQELVEDGLVRAAREVAEQHGRYSREAFDLICKLYDIQPTIAARSSNRIKMQQYSTPLPMAWNAARFAMSGKQDGKVLEPTAGNGMLVFAVPVKQVHVNELDETRLDNLREQGFDRVTQQDATKPFEGGQQYDVVIANPPFGSREGIEYDGKTISGLDPQITLNALASMKDDGKAAIIIGGNMEYANNGGLKSMKPFFTYLYDHYNVKGVIDMDGKLYAKQGTTYPTRMILIDGRRSNEERAQTAVYPPVESKALRKAENFNELYDIIDEILNSKEKTNGTEILRSQQGQLVSVADRPSGNTDGKRHIEQSRTNDTGRSGRGASMDGTQEQSEVVLRGEHRADIGDGKARRGTGGNTTGGSRGIPEPDVQRVETVGASTDRVGLNHEQKKRDLTEEKLPYRPHNSAFSLNSVAPAAMVEAMDRVLSQIEEENGNIDEFVRKELGYDTIEESHQALAAEQMDSVAMAIYQMKKGQALIIGDQTGVGKGRQMAALIRWAVKRGEKPIFITQKADLFSDIYRDLVDIGSGDLVPFIFNSPSAKENKGEMVDANGKVVYRGLSDAKMKKVMASGKLPDGYDYAVLTYSQVNSGDEVSQKEAEETAKKRGGRTKKSKASKDGKATPKATFLRAIAKDNYLFLDESHTAAGTSNTGAYLQSILRSAKAATFASATFAKRPDTMPLYAIRTAMSQAKIEPDKLISIIEKGGVTLQEIMSRELTNAGQMVRRERDMSDVVTDWKTIDNPETVKYARDNYDRTIAAFNAIIKFQEDYVKPMIEAVDKELAVYAESAGIKRGTDKLGVENVPFASKTYNYTKQLMLALKVDAIANEVDAEIKAGKHPVIALESTMESSIKDYSAGEVIEEPTFSASLLRGLDTVMQYTIKDENGKEQHARYSPKQLGEAGEKAYYELQDFIRESTSDIFISPLDAIIERLHNMGYKVGELTGRNMYVERDDDGRVVVRRRTDKDKKRMQREFNNGGLDVLILNKSASTGISLHASEKFSDQRQRTMIIAQPLSDINDYMQMIGRIDRTGQVHRGYYINLGLPVPAENRFLMMLSTKLKSLNANTTTSQDSESNDVEAPDLLNKYGSQVVVEYLRDNPEIYEKMGNPLKKGEEGGGTVQASELDDYKSKEDDARKITGYVALLTTKEQEEFYDDVVRRYNELIKYLNDTGNNDLKITVMPLRAKTLEKRVSSEGIDPTGTNPFAKNSYVEQVEMDVLRKPMKAAEIRKAIDQVNKGQRPEDYLRQIIATIEEEDKARIAAEEARYERSKVRAQEDIAKQTEKINRQQKRTAEEKRAAIAEYTEETNEKVESRHNDNLVRLNTNSDMLKQRLQMFEIGKSYLMPDNLESMVFDFSTPAIFCGYKAKDSKVTASTTLAVFATLDGRRRMEIKLSDIGALRSIYKTTNDNWDVARSTTLENWDSQIPTGTRKIGYIMTGNILQAIADTQDERGGFPGQLISYTDIDGNVHDGILMPDKWNRSMLKTSGAPIINHLQQIKDYKPVTSHDGKVEITGSSWAKTFYLTVPKTKKDGAVYYENKVLLRSIDGNNFYPYRGKLRADIPAENIEEVVKELSKLGVKVKEDAKDDDVLYRTDDYATSEEEANERFNEELDKFTVERADNFIFSLGMPSSALLSGGVENKPIKLYGSKIAKKMRKHGFKSSELRDLPLAVAHPIAVFNNTDRPGNRSVLTELKTENGNILVTLDLGKGMDADFDIVSSMFGKSGNSVVHWINKGLATYIDKEKALNYLHLSAPIAEASNNQELSSATNVVKNFDNPNVNDENLREGNGILTDDELSISNDPVEKVTGKQTRTAAQRKAFAERERQHMADAARSLAEQLHLTNVDIVTDASTLEGRRAKAKGFYSRSTSRITIVIPNHASVYDVEQTLLHEAVAHYGLRELFGEHFDTFLDNVFQNADADIRREITEMAKKHNWDFRTATEEYLASLAENTNFENVNANWWGKIKEMFLRMLHQIGFENFSGVTLSDNELRYILWRSYENLAEPGRYRSILGEAADVAKQSELKIGNYAVKEQTDNQAADSELYRDGDPEVHERTLARDRYEQRIKRRMYQSWEALQDSMLSLREAMESILKGEGKKRVYIEDVDGFENAYLGENRLSSVNKAEADAFAHLLFKPLLDEVAKLAQTKEERDRLTDYMMAKHGLERNRMMRQREKDKLVDASELSKTKPQPPSKNDDDYDLKMDAYNKAMEDWNNQIEVELGDKFEAIDQRDFAGLTALTDADNVADAEAEARQMVEDYESDHGTGTLWKRTHAVSNATLSKLYESGMMSKDTYNNIRSMYKYYIPLRGFDEKTGEETYAYLNSKNSAFNSPIKTAKGRKSKADDPFAYLQSMAESAIVQGNRNKLVKQKFLNFVLNHPSDLASVSDIWLKYEKVIDEWQPVFPDNINADDTPEEVERKMQKFEDKMKELAEKEPNTYKHGKDTVNIPYRIVEKRDLRQHQIVVKRGGRDYVITINGNPRVAQAINGQTNPDNDISGAIGVILKAGERINRELSALYTTRNPDFVVSNFIRDMLYSNSMMWIKESPNYALRFHRNFAKVNPTRMKLLFAKYRKNELDMSNDTERMFHQFMMNGGETGYSNMRDIEKHKNDIRREIRKANGKMPIRKAWGLLTERLDEYNRAVENCARFAAFMTSREMGRTIDRSIYDAKEISVNFNKKGSGAKFMGANGQTKLGNASAFMSGLGRSGFVFWNAAIQGTANFGRQAKRHPAKALTGLAAIFLLGAIVAYLGYDDDDGDDKNSYWNLPEYVRRSNLLFRAGNQWISIPLPVEYRAVYGLGELMTSTLSGKEHFTDGELADKIAGQVSQLLPLDFMEGGGGMKAFIPSAIKPFAEASLNTSWTGLPIYKDTPYNKNMPEWTKAYKSANKYLVDLSETLNEISDGDKYTKGWIDKLGIRLGKAKYKFNNPEQVEYVLNGYFGGVANTIDRMAKMGETIIGQREYDPKSFLVLNRILKSGDERTEYKAINNEYFRLKEEHDEIGRRLRNYQRDTDNGVFDYAEKIDFLYNSPEYRRYEIFERYMPDIDDLYDMLKEANSYGDKEEVKDIEAQLNELKKMMISDMNDSRK